MQYIPTYRHPRQNNYNQRGGGIEEIYEEREINRLQIGERFRGVHVDTILEVIRL